MATRKRVTEMASLPESAKMPSLEEYLRFNSGKIAQSQRASRLSIPDSVPLHDDWAYAWVIDEPGRIEEVRGQGWTPVKKDGAMIFDPSIAISDGSDLVFHLGNSDGKKQYLFGKPSHLRDKELNAYHEETERRMSLIKNGDPLDGTQPPKSAVISGYTP